MRGEYDSNTNADVIWDGPEYARLRPMLYGYTIFQTLFAACQLDMFTTLSKNPGMTASELSNQLGLPVHSTRLLLIACSSIELVVKNQDRYYNSHVSEKLLVRGKPKCAIPFVFAGQFLQYKGFYHLLDALKQEANVGLQEYWGEGKTIYERMSSNHEIEIVLYEAMEAIWELSHAGLDRITEFQQVTHLLDVAGGNAVAASLLHDKYPHLRISIFDRPSACVIAKEVIAKNGKQGSIDTIPGDMFMDPFPSEPDGIIFCHTLEEFSAADSQKLVQKSYAALPEGGKLFAFDFTCRDDERGDLYGARLSLYFLVNATGSGMAYPPKDYVGWFEDAGFTGVEVYSGLPFEHVVVVGTKA